MLHSTIITFKLYHRHPLKVFVADWRVKFRTAAYQRAPLCSAARTDPHTPSAPGSGNTIVNSTLRTGNTNVT